MSVYNLNNKAAMNIELSIQVEESISSMYDLADYSEYFELEISKARIARMELGLENKVLTTIDTMVSEEVYSKTLQELPKELRAKAWEYRRLELRFILLFNILNNSKKLGYLVTKSLEEILHTVLFHGKNDVTISQIIHRIPLKANTYKDRKGQEHKLSAWGEDELRLQLVNELAELDLINMRVSHKTHVVSLPDAYTNKVSKEDWAEMSKKAKILSRKTILVEPAGVDKGMISQSSWWYRTPELSIDQMKFVEVMHNLKWKFVDDAENLIEEAFRKHLKVDKLPKWAIARVEEYKAQIRVSNANDGHYIAGKFDSALRWYWQAEIGHTQTSGALRALVKPLGMVEPTKYDMSNNVVQMYAVALKDRGLAKYVSLVSSEDTVEDLRMQLCKYLNKHLKVSTFDKDNTKPLFMIWAYNAGKKRLLEGAYTEQKNFFTGEMERTITAEGLRSIANRGGCKLGDDEIWSIFSGILAQLVPSIVELKRVMASVVRGNPFTEATWTLPDGAIAQYASVVTNSKELHWISSNGVMRQHTHYRKELESNAKASGLLPRMIHSIDAYMARTLVIRASSLGITVVPNHDSFMFDAQHMDTMDTLMKGIFIEIMEENVFYNMVKEYNTKNVRETGEYVERDLLTAQDIQVSNPWKLEEL